MNSSLFFQDTKQVNSNLNENDLEKKQNKFYLIIKANVKEIINLIEFSIDIESLKATNEKFLVNFGAKNTFYSNFKNGFFIFKYSRLDQLKKDINYPQLFDFQIEYKLSKISWFTYLIKYRIVVFFWNKKAFIERLIDIEEEKMTILEHLKKLKALATTPIIQYIQAEWLLPCKDYSLESMRQTWQALKTLFDSFNLLKEIGNISLEINTNKPFQNIEKFILPNLLKNIILFEKDQENNHSEETNHFKESKFF